MLTESAPYKRDLLRLATMIERWHQEPRWSERRLYAYEKHIFLAFYIIRRLSESNKLSEPLVAREIPVQVFRPTGQLVTLMSRYDVWELYDLKRPQRTHRTLLFLCNQVIHSYIFQIWVERSGRSSSIFFTSDRHRRKAAYRMTRGTFVWLLRKVGSNYPSLVELKFDEQRQDYGVRLV